MGENPTQVPKAKEKQDCGICYTHAHTRKRTHKHAHGRRGKQSLRVQLGLSHRGDWGTTQGIFRSASIANKEHGVDFSPIWTYSLVKDIWRKKWPTWTLADTLLSLFGSEKIETIKMRVTVPCSTPDVLSIIYEKMCLMETRGEGCGQTAFPACPRSHDLTLWKLLVQSVITILYWRQ